MKTKALAAIAVILLLLPACTRPPDAVETEPPVTSTPQQVEPETTPAPVPEEPQWTMEDLNAMALTLSGECYDDKVEDKRLVCEVILNRVSDGRFGATIIEVLSAENQFSGYWEQSRPVSENDLAVAEQALRDWYDNGCEPLSSYLFFCAGENRENNFK